MSGEYEEPCIDLLLTILSQIQRNLQYATDDVRAAYVNIKKAMFDEVSILHSIGASSISSDMRIILLSLSLLLIDIY